MSGRTHYATLGLAPEASYDDIEAAYLTRAFSTGGQDAAVVEAGRVLLDPYARGHYDAGLGLPLAMPEDDTDRLDLLFDETMTSPVARAPSRQIPARQRVGELGGHPVYRVAGTEQLVLSDGRVLRPRQVATAIARGLLHLDPRRDS